ncbi:MAG: hypothetical protein KF864_02800 [Phycisphaeraceae bacterium]|nr:hypothetical protein [Phycisphaeraceae bacterium]
MPKPGANGVPTVYAASDVNRDGVCDGFDPQDWDDYNDYGVGALAADLDVNRDGVVDSADRALVQGHADWALWTSHGRGSVSRLHNRRGYAEYEYDPATSQWHVRHRVLVSEMGRWNRRDPLGYVDGMSVYEYVGSMAVLATDPSGLVSMRCSASSANCGIARDPIDPNTPGDGPSPWRPERMCDGIPMEWELSRCKNCAEQAEQWASMRIALPPSDSCYQAAMRHYMMHCQSIGLDPGDAAMKALQECRARRQTRIPNACGATGGWVKYVPVPNSHVADFSACCNNHDLCWGTCGASKSMCDSVFDSCMAAVCLNMNEPEPLSRVLCMSISGWYYRAVRDFGGSAYANAQFHACRGAQ